MKLNIGAAIAVVSLALGSLFHPVIVQSQSKPTPVTPVVPSKPTTPQPSSKHLKVLASISGTSDLKVHQGDTVKVGDVIAERTTERTHLEVQRNQEQIALKKLEVSTLIQPQLHQIPGIVPLPSANYAVEVASINAASSKLNQARTAYELYQQADPTTLTTSAAQDLSFVNERSTSQAVITQIEKVDQLQSVEDLPPEVLTHEQKTLDKLKDTDVKANAELQLKTAEVKAAKLFQAEKVLTLKSNITTMVAELQLANSKLEAARTHRRQQEYQHSIELSRQAIAINSSRQEFAKAQRELSESERRRILDIEQVRSRIAEIDAKIAQIAIYKAPIDGTIKRVKFLEQGSDGLLKVEIILEGGLSSRGFISGGQPNPESSSRGFISGGQPNPESSSRGFNLKAKP